MMWMGMENNTKPIEWGWKQENDQLVPFLTQSNAAPVETLKIINCNYSVNPLHEAADTMYSPALLYSVLALLKTATSYNLQEVCTEDEEDETDSLSETNCTDEGDCVSDDSGQRNVIHCIS
ncbi:hypothetical protein DPMN_187239 [Dreissena polymorpha]|uniref:Uncharacterized protein n=1 Tax=Dreissena polymorpha TaxID=45954 RepID=A0A9D4IA57_DREPO|nr:hypothetical protein DPMN_187239 [Dreissena polymorpha]